MTDPRQQAAEPRSLTELRALACAALSTPRGEPIGTRSGERHELAAAVLSLCARLEQAEREIEGYKVTIDVFAEERP